LLAWTLVKLPKNKIRQNERKEKERKKERKAKEMGYMRDFKAFTLPGKRNP